MPVTLTDGEVEQMWDTQICRRAQDDGDTDEPNWGAYDWEGVWMGFVIALGRTDLANYDAYMRLGFPHEADI